MLQKKIFFPFSIVIISLLWHSFSNCQIVQQSGLNKEELTNIIFSKNHISFSVVPNVAEKAIVNRKNTNRYNMGASAQRSLEAGFNYRLNFSKTYSLISGIHAGVAGRNLLYAVSSEDFDPPTSVEITSEGLPSRDFDVTYFSLPILFEKRWLNNKNSFWNVNLGINIRYSPPIIIDARAFVLYNNRQPQNFFTLNLQVDKKQKPWVNYNFGGGYSLILPNNNIVRANLITNASFTEFIKGTYAFTLPNKPVEEGTYVLKGSYLGMSISYILTGTNNALRKLYFKEIGK